MATTIVTTGLSLLREPNTAEARDDTDVALVVSNPGLHACTVTRRVTTTEVAPTILRALGLDPNALEGVHKESTKTLPGLKSESEERHTQPGSLRTRAARGEVRLHGLRTRAPERMIFVREQPALARQAPAETGE
jgi:hypothetical protein